MHLDKIEINILHAFLTIRCKTLFNQSTVILQLNVLMLHVDINDWHATCKIIILHIYIIYVACRGQKHATTFYTFWILTSLLCFDRNFLLKTTRRLKICNGKLWRWYMERYILIIKSLYCPSIDCNSKDNLFCKS